ncbi:hypothetical protein ACIRYZ_21815 [Kitasatospora sp. NPDC101155]|uniref:hypothetical protein n=1 Tax=Kitasatospora sp. NPDC101155 TaxID=3364097 RepID=UPI003811AF64
MAPPWADQPGTGQPPGPLTQGRWCVHRIGWLIAPALCHTSELKLIQPARA